MQKNNKKNILDSFVSKTKIYLVIILALMIGLCIYNKEFILPLVIAYLLILS